MSPVVLCFPKRALAALACLLLSIPAAAQEMPPEPPGSVEAALPAPTPPAPVEAAPTSVAGPGEPAQAPAPVTKRAYEAPPRAETDDDFLQRGSSVGAALSIGYGTEKWWTSHLRFMGERALHPNVALFAHLMWPILAVDEPIKTFRARSWTFLGLVGPQGILGAPDWPVRPFLRLGIGLQLVVSEVEFRTGGQGETYSTTAVVGTAAAGLPIRLTRSLSLQLEGETGWSKSFNPGLVADATTRANSTLRRASVGVLFGR